ncbi:hypothetical protein ACKFRT_04455 [Corynebacterium sp. YSMAA1_1_F7]|uniref:hypothetical protein n=1 Tax=Corynebacterium sp. YSMAA1_1_F7 TaxID=3383590 RepID=UPI0038D207B5
MNNNTDNNPAPVVKRYRVIPTAHPAYKAFEKNVLDQAERDYNSVEEWLDAEDGYTNDATPYELDNSQRVCLADMFAVSLAAMTVMGTILLIAWHLGKLLV